MRHYVSSQSLFVSNKQVGLQASSRMDISAETRSYPLPDDMDFQGCIYYVLDEMCCNDIVRTRIVVYYIHSKEFML
jgi:hypothetical protein